ncbi:hypothetical protein [Seleniivibrio woodruffii]|uniref:ATP synthase subunit C n=1 Tax=Seleniivibrio woodruffii TaxID=1078050 RepID=A0A4R1K8J7_9BACT|nr:hypothetical protein [Seleniivibrio woodruffii]TCK59449.1 ATP synthase subunit C [Seleniivibrio woodruffii]TVZ35510.1 ATP synthase subunit C [Seleniivibrio woodruffii]
MTFENYFDMAVKTFRSMAVGIFLYPLFVALTESFDLNLHYFLARPTVETMGIVFIVISVVFFPLSNALLPLLSRKCGHSCDLGKKLMIASVITAGMAETIALFGLVIYIVSADVRFFYLFFVLSLVHLFMHRPKMEFWQRHLDIMSRD